MLWIVQLGDATIISLLNSYGMPVSTSADRENRDWKSMYRKGFSHLCISDERRFLLLPITMPNIQPSTSVPAP